MTVTTTCIMETKLQHEFSRCKHLTSKNWILYDDKTALILLLNISLQEFCSILNLKHVLSFANGLCTSLGRKLKFYFWYSWHSFNFQWNCLNCIALTLIGSLFSCSIQSKFQLYVQNLVWANAILFVDRVICTVLLNFIKLHRSSHKKDTNNNRIHV